MKCESEGFKDPAIQSSYKNPDGTRERSFGVAQWNLDYNPEITYENAIDPAWSLEHAADSWEHGQANHWSCYRNLFS